MASPAKNVQSPANESDLWFPRGLVERKGLLSWLARESRRHPRSTSTAFYAAKAGSPSKSDLLWRHLTPRKPVTLEGRRRGSNYWRHHHHKVSWQASVIAQLLQRSAQNSAAAPTPTADAVTLLRWYQYTHSGLNHQQKVQKNLLKFKISKKVLKVEQKGPQKSTTLEQDWKLGDFWELRKWFSSASPFARWFAHPALSSPEKL